MKILQKILVMTIVAMMGGAPVVAVKHDCQCPCACAPDGGKLKDLINCFATWEENAATNGNSQLEGCDEKSVSYCKTVETNKFCKFDGTNNLVESDDNPDCYYNCGMRAQTRSLRC